MFHVGFISHHSNLFNGQRSGSPTNDHRCDQITSVPAHLTFITKYRHYQKYTHAYGIPVVSSYAVSDAALKRACYVVRLLLADSHKVRYHMYKYFGRAGVIGVNEGVRSIPEHSWLPSWWDQRARGLGGTLSAPVSTGAEENLLCWSNDRYWNEDIFLHEFSHGIQEIALTTGAIPSFNARLQNAYSYAKSRGLWANTYAMSTWKEYFAEGVQSYFNVNAYASPPDGVHNTINTRDKLRRYDPILFGLVKEVFPCENLIQDRCDKTGTLFPLRMNCDGSGGQTVTPLTTNTSHFTKQPATTATSTTISTGTKNVCEDNNQYCSSWAAAGECSRNPGYMHVHCQRSCSICGSGCMDSNQYCNAWARGGYCQTNAGWMLLNCKKSCRAC